MIKIFNNILLSFGLNISQLFFSIFDIPRFLKNYFILIKTKSRDNHFPIIPNYPVLGELYKPGGAIRSHYFMQDLFVARMIYAASPKFHYDIGSRVDGFVAHLATFMDIKVLDIRKIPNTIKGIEFIQYDITDSNNMKVNSIESLSSLHVFEHIGLGRYGDKIDYFGHINALNSVYRIMKIGGIFYFSVPIGKQRIQYNAHRVFSVSYLSNLFIDKWKVVSFSYITDNSELIENVDYEKFDSQKINYGCGIFVLKKI